MKRWAVILALLAVTASGWRVFQHHKRKAPPPRRVVVWQTWRADLESIECRLMHGRTRVAHWTALSSIHSPREMR